MVNEYFHTVTNQLTVEDLTVLGVLQDNDANAPFKAIGNQKVLCLSNLSEARYRKVLYRLIAIQFVANVTGNKEHGLYITEYGEIALNDFLERMIS